MEAVKSLSGVYGTLRRKNLKQYLLLAGCVFFSVLLITSLAVMIQSNTVQTILPEGGDSRKQMYAVFALAIVGCGIFTTYASSLFFRSKSRESGILMALGTTKRRLGGLLLGDVALIALVSTLGGLLLATPLAAGLWQIFRLLVVDTAEMAFSISGSGYLWGIAFSVFCLAMLLLMALRFVRRSNIIDVVNEQRKSEPIRDVKSWYGWCGIALMLAGGFGGYFLPTFCVRVLKVFPPFWGGAVYGLAVIGLYMLLVYVVVHGFGRKNYYKNIITHSMMKFQGRQTVRNMCVIAMLTAGAYFALFYLPMLTAGSLYTVSQYEKDYSFHMRADEDMPGRDEITEMAAGDGIAVLNYNEAAVLTLATDGYDRDFADDGSYINEYNELIAEENFLSESDFRRLSGQELDVAPGGYAIIRSAGDTDSVYSYITELTLLTNPVTMEALPTAYQESVVYPQLYHWFVLDDGDYAALARGLTDDWRERYVQFDVDDVDGSYPFAKRLQNELIDRSKYSAVFENYDRMEKRAANLKGEEYRGDVAPELQVDYSQRDSSDFYRYWKYTPKIRVIEKNDMLRNSAVYLMIFAFVAIVCFAAILVIAYTRCMTIALNNRQVYDDLAHLGANRAYLYRSVRQQISKVFAVPVTIGTVAIFALFTLIMFGNSGAIEPGELLGLGIDVGLIAAISLLVWGVYRFTLKKVCRALGI